MGAGGLIIVFCMFLLIMQRSFGERSNKKFNPGSSRHGTQRHARGRRGTFMAIPGSSRQGTQRRGKSSRNRR